MPINPDAVGTKSEPARRKWNSKDALIYALGVGAGAADPLDELEFTTENTSGKEQRVLPTIAVVLGPLGGAFGAIGSFNPAMLVHGEEGITLHREIPVEGELEAVSEITGIYDKGKGAVVVTESKATLVDTGEPLFDTRMSAYIRGEGGWGGDRGPSGNPNEAPDRDPDHTRRAPDPHRPGADLPAVGRPQPAAQRPGLRGDGRLRPADPPRPVHLRLHRPRAAARAVRQRPGPVQGHGRPLQLAGDARRVAHREGVGRWATAPPSSRPCGQDGRVVIDAGRLTFTA